MSAADFAADLAPAAGAWTVLWHSVMWQYLDDGRACLGPRPPRARRCGGGRRRTARPYRVRAETPRTGRGPRVLRHPANVAGRPRADARRGTGPWAPRRVGLRVRGAARRASGRPGSLPRRAAAGRRSRPRDDRRSARRRAGAHGRRAPTRRAPRAPAAATRSPARAAGEASALPRSTYSAASPPMRTTCAPATRAARAAARLGQGRTPPYGCAGSAAASTSGSSSSALRSSRSRSTAPGSANCAPPRPSTK